jgi:hypothetical protein
MRSASRETISQKGFGERGQHAVGLVAERGMPAARVRVGDGDGPLRYLDGLDGRAFRRVGHVHDETHPVHLLDDPASHAGDAGVLGFVAAGRQQRLVVVGELHETCTERVTDLHEIDVVFDGGAVLEPEKYRRSARLPCLVNVSRGAPRHDQIGVAREAPVPRFDIGDGLAEVLVIADRGVDSIDAALARRCRCSFGGPPR